MYRFTVLESLTKLCITLGMKFLTMSPKCKSLLPLRGLLNQICEYSEALVDEPHFQQRELAASLASKVFYYLEEYEESLRLALESGNQFDINEKNQYVETLIHKCIDKYIEKRVRKVEQNEEVEIDAKMEDVINRMFERCYRDQQYT